MNKQNRMNRSPSSRATLRELERSGVLQRDRVGIRNILRADTGNLDPVGFDLDVLQGSHYRNAKLPNFSAAHWYGSAFVGYRGGRARLLGTQATGATSAAQLAAFPVNPAATGLLQQPCTKSAGLSADHPILGDAFLITDMRYHCSLRPYRHQYTLQDLTSFAGMLTTSHDVIAFSSKPWIFFHEEPCEIDLIAIKMWWK